MSDHTTTRVTGTSVTTVAGYLFGRLAGAGVRSVFGPRGDSDAVLVPALTSHPELTWIETETDRAAAESADAYARLRGLGATLTAARPPHDIGTSAPVVHIVAEPPTAFRRGPGPRTADPGTDLRPEVAAREIDRLLATALGSGVQVEIGIPADVAVAPVPASAGRLPAGGTACGLNWTSLWAAVQDFLVPHDVLVIDQDALDRAPGLALPGGARLIAEAFPSPAGWASSAALGASLAAPDCRVVVLSSDRSAAGAAGLRALLAQGIAPVIIWAREDGIPTPGRTPSGAAAVTIEARSQAALAAGLREAGRRAAEGRLVLVEAVLGQPCVPMRKPEPGQRVLIHLAS